MDTKLIKVPEKYLDDYINHFIQKSNKINIAVSFFFKSGLSLIIDALESFSNKENINIITSNYLNSTEPEALWELLNLKNNGAKIYIYDSIKSGKGFHIKCYSFTNEKDKFFRTIIGSSNVSRAAFRDSHEVNNVSDEKDLQVEISKYFNKLLNDGNCYALTADFIKEYELNYKSENNIFLNKSLSEDIEVIAYKEPNIIQKDALEIIGSNRELGVKKGLVVMATGLGKTILSALDVSSFKPKKMLFVAHREEILKQSCETFKNFIKQKTFGFYQGEKKESNKDYLFGSIQTIGRKSELEKFRKDEFDYIIIDEFHHTGAKSYKNLIDYF